MWDNSQNWSGGEVTGGGPLNLPWSNAFDGNLSTRPNVSSGTSTLTFTTPLDINGKTVEIYAQGGTTGNGTLKFNGKTWNGGGITSNQWVDITSVFAGDTTFDSITLDFESNPAYLWAIRVGGALLIDAGDQWDTSQIWSDTVQYEGVASDASGNDYSPSSGFDGNPVTYFAAIPTTPITVDLSNLGLTGEVLFHGATADQFTSLNGAAAVKTDSNSGYVSLGTITDQSNAVITAAAVNSQSLGFYGIKVGGVLLVDAYGPGFGDNGFYLPFDPAQTGENYSSRIATRTGDVSTPEWIFNGDLTKGFGNGNNSNNNLATITFDPVFKAERK